MKSTTTPSAMAPAACSLTGTDAGGTMFHINTVPAKAMRKKGYARYPEDFPHLTSGTDFAAWRSGEDWEIETTLDGQALIDRWLAFYGR